MAELKIDCTKLAKETADKALNEIQYYGRSIKEWMDLIIRLYGWFDNSPENMTNYQVIQNMTREELSVLLADLEHYTDVNYEWQSKLTPLLPFEDWADWLDRKAIYRENV